VNTQTIVDFLLAAVPVVLAITLHEAAHGYAALALGDTTARDAGRLSLNPLAHIDRFGTILLPGFLVISQLLLPPHRIQFLFGWAKPVPVDVRGLRNPRRAMMLVAAAGPLMNFFLAWLGVMGLYLLPFLTDAAAQALWQFLQYFVLVNMVLGAFNLLPIPPLDGGRIVVGLLPLPLARRWARLERAGLLIVILLIFLLPMLARDAGFAFSPVQAWLDAVADPILRVVLTLAGHPPSADALLGYD
jgi:Zn-dependent protease